MNTGLSSIASLKSPASLDCFDATLLDDYLSNSDASFKSLSIADYLVVAAGYFYCFGLPKFSSSSKRSVSISKINFLLYTDLKFGLFKSDRLDIELELSMS